MPAAHASAFALNRPMSTPPSVSTGVCSCGMLSFMCSVPPRGACGYSESSTTAAARPSGKGCCSSLMKRRFMGKATSTPRMLARMFHSSIWCHCMGVLVMNMYAISAEMSGPVM